MRPAGCVRSVGSESEAYLLGWTTSRAGCGGDGSAGAERAEEEAPGSARAASAGRAEFPPLTTRELGWAFVRGCFDARGRIDPPGTAEASPSCTLATHSPKLCAGIRGFTGIGCSETEGRLEWSGNNALDLLSKLYDGAAVFLPRNRDLYLDWAAWVPSLSGPRARGRDLLFRWAKTHAGAVPPYKERASDSGYDLTFIRRVERRGQVELFGTGLKVEPAYGWYFDLVPRSSIMKVGYLLANSVGVIDRAYRGEIMVPLLKVDPDTSELALPCRVVQLIPRPIVHARFVEVESLGETSREARGFGSSGGQSD